MSRIKLFGAESFLLSPDSMTAANSSFPQSNAFSIGTGAKYRTNAEVTSSTAVYSFGSNVAFDYFFFANADLNDRPSLGDVDYTITAGASSVAFDRTDFKGGNISEFFTLASDTDWSITVDTDWTGYHFWSYVILCQSLDLGRYPEPGLSKRLRYADGRRKGRRALYEYTLTFSGVDKDLVSDLQEWYQKAKNGPVVLAEETESLLTDSHVIGEVISIDVVPVTRHSFRISLRIGEVI